MGEGRDLLRESGRDRVKGGERAKGFQREREDRKEGARESGRGRWKSVIR